MKAIFLLVVSFILLTFNVYASCELWVELVEVFSSDLLLIRFEYVSLKIYVKLSLSFVCG